VPSPCAPGRLMVYPCAPRRTVRGEDAGPRPRAPGGRITVATLSPDAEQQPS
jgi:hypothetical protein